jgi:hypothetical protein
MPGDYDAWNMLLAELQASGLLFGLRQTLKIARFGVSENLYTLFCEIAEEPGECEPGTIDGRFANLALETKRGSDQLELESVRMPGVELTDRDKW